MTHAEQINELGVVLSIQAWPAPEDLEAARLALEQDGGLAIAWHDRPAPTKEELWAEAQRLDVVYFVGYVQPIGGERKIAGLGWAVDIAPYKGGLEATVGQAFDITYQVKNVCKELATMMLDYGFEQCGFRRVNGFTPLPNKAAVRFVKKMQFRTIGIARNKGTWQRTPCDLLVSSMTRSEWNLKGEF